MSTETCWGVRTFATLKDKAEDHGEDYGEDYGEVMFNKILQYATVPISLESAPLHPLHSFAGLITMAGTKQ